MFSPRFKSKYTIGAFLLLFACSPICLGESGEDGNKDNKVNILFSYGPGGPLKPNNEFFAGEPVYFYVETDVSFTKDAQFDLTVRSKVLHRLNETADIVHFAENQGQVFSFLSDKQSTFHITGNSRVIPENLKGGTYDLQINIYDALNHSTYQKQVPIIIKDHHDFGLRNIVFVHGFLGNDTWIMGSNAYRVGEFARVYLAIGGCVADENNFLNVNLDISVLNPKNKIIYSKNDPVRLLNHELFKNTANYTQQLVFNQPGEYTLKIKIEDINSGKTDTCELPLIVLPVPSPVSVGGRGLGN